MESGKKLLIPKLDALIKEYPVERWQRKGGEIVECQYGK